MGGKNGTMRQVLRTLERALNLPLACYEKPFSRATVVPAPRELRRLSRVGILNLGGRD